MSEHPKSTSRRAVTISNRRGHLLRAEIEEGIQLELDGAYDYTAPRTRSECTPGPRPCPWVSCQYHLYLDVTSSGGIRLNFPALEPHQLEWSCVLDEAEKEGLTLEAIGACFNITRERIRQVEAIALDKLRETLDGRLLIRDMLHLQRVRDHAEDIDDGYSDG
jgi:hypothetical protein